MILDLLGNNFSDVMFLLDSLNGFLYDKHTRDYSGDVTKLVVEIEWSNSIVKLVFTWLSSNGFITISATRITLHNLFQVLKRMLIIAMAWARSFPLFRLNFQLLKQLIRQ